MAVINMLEDFGTFTFQGLFVKEINDEVKKFNIEDIPAGMQATRRPNYWEFEVEFIGRMDMNDLYNLIKCTNHTIKFYNRDVESLDELKKLLTNPASETNVSVCIYSEEGVMSFLKYANNFDLCIRNFNGRNMQPCKRKSDVKNCIQLTEPTYITVKGETILCDTGSYIIQYNDNTYNRVSKEAFEEGFELI